MEPSIQYLEKKAKEYGFIVKKSTKYCGLIEVTKEDSYYFADYKNDAMGRLQAIEDMRLNYLYGGCHS